MYFYNKIKELCEDKKIVIYVDMDGVIASFDFGYPCEFDKKRPLLTNIKTLEEVSKLDNVELKILSACRKDYQIKEKNIWLDEYAPFFIKENRNILSRESHNNELSSVMKASFLADVKDDRTIVLVDDDIAVLRLVNEQHNNIICMQDSELID